MGFQRAWLILAPAFASIALVIVSCGGPDRPTLENGECVPTSDATCSVVLGNGSGTGPGPTASAGGDNGNGTGGDGGGAPGSTTTPVGDSGTFTPTTPLFDAGDPGDFFPIDLADGGTTINGAAR